MKNANTINILKPNSTSAKKKREYAPMIDVEKGINEIAYGVSGILTKPIEGTINEGIGGFFKGIGKGVLGFSLLRPFKSCIGIEYLENLIQISQNILSYSSNQNDVQNFQKFAQNYFNKLNHNIRYYLFYTDI